MDEFIETYQVEGEYWGVSEARAQTMKNSSLQGRPKQPCDIICLLKKPAQLSFEAQEEERKNRSLVTIFFEQLENIRNSFSVELVPLRSFRKLMEELKRKQEDLVPHLSLALQQKLQTSWKNAYDSFLICGENELLDLGYSKEIAKKMHALVLFYKPVPIVQ